MTEARANDGATGVITVDLGQIAANWRALAALVAPAACGAVVKADAYGLGAARVIPALATAGCRTFFVATADEAAEARSLAPEVELFVLDGVLAGSTQTLNAACAKPVLASLDDLSAWARVAAAHGKPLAAALQLDTGLARLGLSEGDIERIAGERLLDAGIDVSLVMSHLACADDPAHPKNESQRQAFDRIRAHLPVARASLAASDGLMLGKPFHYDLVRPGYALYGGQAFQGGPTPVEPVVTVRSRVLQVRDVAAGDSVGYSATWTAQRPSRIAILAAGYADGIARALSSGDERAPAVVGFGAATAPIVGRVSMDLITVDVTDVRPAPQAGDFATLVGPGLTIEAMGSAAGTIGYEVLTRLGRRFSRTYVDG